MFLDFYTVYLRFVRGTKITSFNLRYLVVVAIF